VIIDMWKDLQHKEWYKRGQDLEISKQETKKERQKALEMWGK